MASKTNYQTSSSSTTTTTNVSQPNSSVVHTRRPILIPYTTPRMMNPCQAVVAWIPVYLKRPVIPTMPVYQQHRPRPILPAYYFPDHIGNTTSNVSGFNGGSGHLMSNQLMRFPPLPPPPYHCPGNIVDTTSLSGFNFVPRYSPVSTHHRVPVPYNNPSTYMTGFRPRPYFHPDPSIQGGRHRQPTTLPPVAPSPRVLSRAPNTTMATASSSRSSPRASRSCLECGESFPSSFALGGHMSYHSKKRKLEEEEEREKERLAKIAFEHDLDLFIDFIHRLASAATNTLPTKNFVYKKTGHRNRMKDSEDVNHDN